MALITSPIYLDQIYKMASPMSPEQSSSIPDNICEDICKKWQIERLEDFQKQALHNIIIKREDTLVCMPTGSGKSLCYEALSFACEQFRQNVNTRCDVSDIACLAA